MTITMWGTLLTILSTVIGIVWYYIKKRDSTEIQNEAQASADQKADEVVTQTLVDHNVQVNEGLVRQQEAAKGWDG